MTDTDGLWSVLRYDLKTALEVVGLPCCLKLAENRLGGISEDLLQRSGIGVGSVIKIEKEIRFPCVRARICAPLDLDWFLFTKGEDFVREHSYHINKQLYIPVGYRGKLRLCDREGGKTYCNIREVVADFPRFVRVDQETVCATPGCKTYQVVKADTVLELDRVTEGNRVIRGKREKYLVCTDIETRQELTFQVFSPVRFTKLEDNTKYVLSDLVEHLPLPQTVEFSHINPYDVFSVDDEESRDLHVMLSGPVEILEMTMVTLYVGLIQSQEQGRCDIITIPVNCDLDTQTMVYIPISYIMEGVENPYCKYKLGPINIDVIREGLYLNTVGHKDVSLLKNLKTRILSYESTELPDTPRLPKRSNNFMTMKSTVSAPTGEDTGDSGIPELDTGRKRFRSTGDIKRRNRCSVQSTDREPRGFRNYWTQLARRVKSSASQLLFGIHVDSYTLKPLPDPEKQREPVYRRNSGSRKSVSPLKSSGFVCYIDAEDSGDKDTAKSDTTPDTTRDNYTDCDNHKSNDKVSKYIRVSAKDSTTINSDECSGKDDGQAKDSMNTKDPPSNRNSINSLQRQTRDISNDKTVAGEVEEEAIYAYIERTPRNIIVKVNRELENKHKCSVCYDIFQMQSAIINGN